MQFPVQPGAVPPRIATAAGQTPFEPNEAPVVVEPPAAVGPIGAAPVPPPLVVGLSAGGEGAGGGAPAAPPQVPLSAGPKSILSEPSAGRQDEPAAMGGPLLPPTFRMGYAEYLRTATMTQVAALALPGAAGILALTGLGGLLGYRQAKAGRAVRMSELARYMN